jgi:hypothetical protein
MSTLALTGLLKTSLGLDALAQTATLLQTNVLGQAINQRDYETDILKNLQKDVVSSSLYQTAAGRALGSALGSADSMSTFRAGMGDNTNLFQQLMGLDRARDFSISSYSTDLAAAAALATATA